MAQDIYYNDIVAQLVELRNKIGEGGGGSGEGGGGTIDTSKLEAKLDEVIKAVKEIKVSTDSISVEAGTINLSTDELESILKETRDYIKNIIGEKKADDEPLYDLIYVIDNNLANITGKVIKINNSIANIDTKLGDTTTPADGTINKSLLQLKDTATYNADSNFKSSQALTESTAGKGIADITKELGDYLKNVIGLKDEDIGNLYELISSIDSSTLSIKSIVNVIKTLTQSSTNNISIIQGILGNTINPNDGTVLKLLNELKTLIAPNSDVTVDTVISKLKDIMVNDTAIANAQLTVGDNHHTELLNAINNGTLSTYLQSIIGPSSNVSDTIYNLISSIDDQTYTTKISLGKKDDISAGGTNSSIQSKLRYLIEALENALLGTDNTPIVNYINELNTNIGNISDIGIPDGSIHAKIKYLADELLSTIRKPDGMSYSQLITESLRDNANSTVVDYAGSIDVNTANVDVSLGKKTDDSNSDGSIHAKLKNISNKLSDGVNDDPSTVQTLQAKENRIIDLLGGQRLRYGYLLDKDVPVLSQLRNIVKLLCGETVYVEEEDVVTTDNLFALLKTINQQSIDILNVLMTEFIGVKQSTNELKTAIDFQNSILNDNFNPPLHDYTIRIVANGKLDPTAEFRLTNFTTSSNSPQNINKDYISLPLNKTLYLNYSDFASTYQLYFYINGVNTDIFSIATSIKILNENKNNLNNGGGNYGQGIAPKGVGDIWESKSIYIILNLK